MNGSDLLRKHQAQCQECERVRQGESPFCSPYTMLVLVYGDQTQTEA